MKSGSSKKQPRLDLTFSVDAVLSQKQFALYLGVSPAWVSNNWDKLPGTINESREVKRIYLRAYLEKRTGSPAPPVIAAPGPLPPMPEPPPGAGPAAPGLS